MKLVATPSAAWGKKKDVETVRRDVAGYGFDTEIVDVTEKDKDGKEKVTGHLLHVTIPSGLGKEDRREQIVRSRLERHYGWSVESKRG